MSLFSVSSNPYTLTGTAITETSTAARALAARVHCGARNRLFLSELWAYRESAWMLFPIQPVSSKGTPIVWKQPLNEPATLDMTLVDPQGVLSYDNVESPYNRNSAGEYDPLLDDTRKVLLRVGVRCYANVASGITPTASQAVSEGALADLTDGVLETFAGALTSYAEWTFGSQTTLTLTVDLGRVVAEVKHCVIRFGTRSGDFSLPESVRVGISTDGASWKWFPVRPVGGDTGDWEDDEDGRAVEVCVTDMGYSARYVRWEVVSNGAQTVVCDEVGVYGGSSQGVLGRNVFVGYLGDSVQVMADGRVQVQATDASRRLLDNTSTRLTAVYEATELGDIVHSLMTSSAYWEGNTDYDDAFDASEIGWSAGSNLTGLTYPLYQGIGYKSIYGYVAELFSGIGWQTYFDGNGVFRAFEPPFRQYLPDRVMIDALDGNGDLRGLERDYNATARRNAVLVTAGKQRNNGASVYMEEPNSVARYGKRQSTIEDPLATEPAIQQKIGEGFLRDFAWRSETATVQFAPDFDTRLGYPYGFRRTGRNPIYAKSCDTVGNRREGRLWTLESLTHTLTTGDWVAAGEAVPYVPSGPDAPFHASLIPDGGINTRIATTWTAITDPKVVSLQIWIATAEAGPYTLAGTVSGGSLAANTANLDGLTNGQRYYVYLVAVDTLGRKSLPSRVLTAVAGGSAANNDGWTVQDLAADLVTRSGPDSEGWYTYVFLASWTSPPGYAVDPSAGGTKRFRIMGNALSSPASPDEWASWGVYDDSWQWWGDYIPPGKTWDRVTTAPLTYRLVLKTNANFTTGQRLYFTIFTTWATTRWRDIFRGNITYVEF